MLILRGLRAGAYILEIRLYSPIYKRLREDSLATREQVQSTS